MRKPDLILIGAGGHARACIDVIEQSGAYQISGLIGAQEDEEQLGYSVIGTDGNLAELVKTYSYSFIAVGQIGAADRRSQLHHKLLALGFQLPTVVSPSAVVSRHAKLGVGSIVMHGAIVNAGARVGDNCIINSRALVEHDAVVEDHCHISTGAILNGGVHVGEGSFVGSGATIREGVRIGRGCLIGMGLTVRHEQMSRTRYTGGN